MKKIISILVFAVFAWFGFAQEGGNIEDELFGSEEDMLLSPDETQKDVVADRLKLSGDLNTAGFTVENSKVRFGGNLNSGLSLFFNWDDPYSKKQDYKKSFLNNERFFSTILGANLFFDARPVENLKLYGKFVFGFPFEKTLYGSANLAPLGVPAKLPVAVTGVPNIKIQELYTDFSAKDIAFFRFGKHTVKWGTGYFYSPADVLNISRIDPEKPEEDREGAVSLRTHIVIPKTQVNIWLYLLPDVSKFLPEYTAGAAKTEFVVGNWELGIGAWYKYKHAPRLITTVSGSIAGKVGVFAEGVFAWGSDYKYYKADAAFTEYEKKNRPFFQATIGASYSITKTHTTIAGQYLYNGFGYKHKDGIFNALAGSLEGTKDEVIGNVYANIAGMGNPGQHYIAFSISQNKIGTEDVSANLFQQFSISERTGSTKINLNWHIYKFAHMTAGLSFSYPLSRDSSSKGSVGCSLGITLGGGRF